MIDVSQPFVVDGRVARLGLSVRSRPTVFCTLALRKILGAGELGWSRGRGLQDRG